MSFYLPEKWSFSLSWIFMLYLLLYNTGYMATLCCIKPSACQLDKPSQNLKILSKENTLYFCAQSSSGTRDDIQLFMFVIVTTFQSSLIMTRAYFYYIYIISLL